MTQRSPMNERYSTEKHKGTTRKSASSAKPKREAAASVTVVAKTKTKAEKKAEKKKLEARQREKTQKYYNPPTPEYKRMRKIWVAFVAGALIASITSFFVLGKVPSEVSTVILVIAYVCIACALYVDLVKIRRIRNKYAAAQRESKADTRARKAAVKANKRKAADNAAAPVDNSVGGKIKRFFGFK